MLSAHPRHALLSDSQSLLRLTRLRVMSCFADCCAVETNVVMVDDGTGEVRYVDWGWMSQLERAEGSMKPSVRLTFLFCLRTSAMLVVPCQLKLLVTHSLCQVRRLPSRELWRLLYRLIAQVKTRKYGEDEGC